MSNKGSIRRSVEAALKATGLPYEIRQGSRHKKVILAGKFIGVLCTIPGKRRDDKQIQAAIRQRLRELNINADTNGTVCRTGRAEI